MRQPYVLAQNSLRRYVSLGIAVDTGLLILAAVGRYDKQYISGFKKTQVYSSEDYDLLTTFLAKFRRLVVSPHVLAELSNHSFMIPGRRLKAYLDVMVRLLLPFHEEHTTKDSILRDPALYTVGVTDTGLIICCEQNDYLLLTGDRKLLGIAQSRGVAGLHFDDLRAYSLNAQLGL